MHPNILGVISAILAILSFFGAYRAARNRPAQTRLLLASLALVAAMPGASFATYYAHILPEPGWYYQFRSLPGTELLVVFVGVAGGLVATLLPRVFLTLPLLGVVIFSLAPIIKPFIGPIEASALKDEWDGAICLQSTPSTCGAASTATVLKYLGGQATESKLAMEAHSYIGGTEAWYLARAARSRGFRVQFDFTPEFSPDRGLPAVVGVRLGSVGHFIAILGREGDKFVVGDPLHGREWLSREDLRQRYTFTGFHMRVKNKGERGIRPSG